MIRYKFNGFDALAGSAGACSGTRDESSPGPAHGAAAHLLHGLHDLRRRGGAEEGGGLQRHAAARRPHCGGWPTVTSPTPP